MYTTATAMHITASAAEALAKEMISHREDDDATATAHAARSGKIDQRLRNDLYTIMWRMHPHKNHEVVPRLTLDDHVTCSVVALEGGYAGMERKGPGLYCFAGPYRDLVAHVKDARVMRVMRA